MERSGLKWIMWHIWRCLNVVTPYCNFSTAAILLTEVVFFVIAYFLWTALCTKHTSTGPTGRPIQSSCNYSLVLLIWVNINRFGKQIVWTNVTADRGHGLVGNASIPGLCCVKRPRLEPDLYPLLFININHLALYKFSLFVLCIGQ